MKRFAIFDLSIDCNKKYIFHDFYVESNLTLQIYLIWWINREIYYFITCCLFFPMLWKIQCDNYFFLVIWICVLTFVNLCLNWFLTWTFLYNLFRKGWWGRRREWHVKLLYNWCISSFAISYCSFSFVCSNLPPKVTWIVLSYLADILKLPKLMNLLNTC